MIKKRSIWGKQSIEGGSIEKGETLSAYWPWHDYNIGNLM